MRRLGRRATDGPRRLLRRVGRHRPCEYVISDICCFCVANKKVRWRILYALTSDAIVILEVFEKKTRVTPKQVLDVAKRRLKKYVSDAEED